MSIYDLEMKFLTSLHEGAHTAGRPIHRQLSGCTVKWRLWTNDCSVGARQTSIALIKMCIKTNPRWVIFKRSTPVRPLWRLSVSQNLARKMDDGGDDLNTLAPGDAVVKSLILRPKHKHIVRSTHVVWCKKNIFWMFCVDNSEMQYYFYFVNMKL